MFTYAALFKPIDLFDPSTEVILAYLLALAIGLVVVKVLLRKRYHALIDQLPDDSPMEIIPPSQKATQGEQKTE